MLITIVKNKERMVSKMKFCQKCGKELADEAKFCDGCGNNVEIFETTVTQSMSNSDAMTVETVAATTDNNAAESSINQFPTVAKTKNLKSKKIKIVAIISIIACVALVAGIVAIVSHNNSLNNYKEKLNEVYDNICVSAEDAEDYCTLEGKVWYNCIHKNSSGETNKYTKDSYGVFYSDFNTALSEFYIGESATYQRIKSDEATISKLMSELKDCPSKYEDEYKAVKEMYKSYSTLTDLVLGDTSYSYNSFNEALNNSISDFKSAKMDAKALFE